MCICMGFDTKLCCDVAAALQSLANASTALNAKGAWQGQQSKQRRRIECPVVGKASCGNAAGLAWLPPLWQRAQVNASSELLPNQRVIRYYGEPVGESLQERQETTRRKLPGQNWPDVGRQLSPILTSSNQHQSRQNAFVTVCRILIMSWRHVQNVGMR